MLHCNRSQPVSIHKDRCTVSGQALPPYISSSRMVLLLTDKPGQLKQLWVMFLWKLAYYFIKIISFRREKLSSQWLTITTNARTLLPVSPVWYPAVQGTRNFTISHNVWSRFVTVFTQTSFHVNPIFSPTNNVSFLITVTAHCNVLRIIR